jgi:hypothetical protein
MKTLHKTLPLIVGFAIAGLIMSLFGMSDLWTFIAMSAGAYTANFFNA